MDSMQSAGTDDADYTYLNVMSNNLVVLKQAFTIDFNVRRER